MGEGRPSLLTVGYTLKNKDKTEFQARTTSGVSELGTATGIYGVNLELPENFVGTIEWDSGESNPVYASEDIALGGTERTVIDDVRTLLRAHLNQFVDFVNKKFKDMPKPEGGVKELTAEVRDLKKRLFSHLDEDEKTDEEWEDNYLDPILEKVDETNRILNEKHEMLVKHVREQLQKVVIPTYDGQLDTLSTQMTELQKDVSILSGDCGKLVDSMKTDLKSVIESVRADVGGVPSKISIPNYEKRLDSIEKNVKDGISYLIKAGKDDMDTARSEVSQGLRELKKVIDEMKIVIGEEGHGMVTSLEKKFSDAVRTLSELLNELHPDTLEKRRLEKQDKINKMQFMTGVKQWQK